MFFFYVAYSSPSTLDRRFKQLLFSFSILSFNSVMDVVLQLEEAEERTGQLQATVRDLEAKLEEARSAVRNKETQLEEQRRKERELLTTVTR